MAAETMVTEIAADTYRISTFHSDYGIQFNQFLVVDDQPFLMHTGFRKMFAQTLAGVSRVMDPARLRWIGFSHFEPDECGALNEWLAVAPDAQSLTGMVGNMVMMSDFADRPGHALADNESLALGKHSLRFLATPHLPHGWDAGLFYDESEKTLFASDLFFQPGNPAPLVESSLVDIAADTLRENQRGLLAHDLPYTPQTGSLLARLASLEPRTLATMHGASYRGDGKQALLDLSGEIRDILGRE